MDPDDKYKDLSPEERREMAIDIAKSVRGGYIVSQALTIAAQVIMARPKEYREPSNVADMNLLRDELFPTYKLVEEARQETVAAGSKGTAEPLEETFSKKTQDETYSMVRHEGRVYKRKA